MATTGQNILFSDFNVSFKVNPNTGDISRLTNEDAVKRAVKNLVLTGYNERLFYPGKGCGVYRLLFDPISFETSFAIQDHIEAVLHNWEPRVSVMGVDVIPNYDNNRYDVTINYQIINETKIRTIDFFLEMIK